MKLAESELQRALQNLDAMSAHLAAMEHTLEAFSKQVEGAKHEMTILRLDMTEIQREVRAAVSRLRQLRAAAEHDPAGKDDRSGV